MEQKAKRIGKLNIIDLIAIVLIVAVLALAAWKFIGKNGDSISYDRPQTKVTYQVKVEGVAPELYENCQAHLPGATVNITFSPSKASCFTEEFSLIYM